MCNLQKLIQIEEITNPNLCLNIRSEVTSISYEAMM